MDERGPLLTQRPQQALLARAASPPCLASTVPIALFSHLPRLGQLLLVPPPQWCAVCLSGAGTQGTVRRAWAPSPHRIAVCVGVHVCVMVLGPLHQPNKVIAV